MSQTRLAPSLSYSVQENPSRGCVLFITSVHPHSTFFVKHKPGIVLVAMREEISSPSCKSNKVLIFMKRCFILLRKQASLLKRGMNDRQKSESLVPQKSGSSS